MEDMSLFYRVMGIVLSMIMVCRMKNLAQLFGTLTPTVVRLVKN